VLANLNAAAAIVAVFLLRKVLARREFTSALAVLALAFVVLVALMCTAQGIETTARQRALLRPDHRLSAFRVPGDRGHQAG
jgi:spermidine synthase